MPTRSIPIRLLAPLVMFAGCGGPAATGPVASQPTSLPEARSNFTTKISSTGTAGQPAPEPPPDIFRLVRYDSRVGPLAAYLSPDPGDGAKHPAILWITGGDCNTIDELWRPAPRQNDQTAAAYRQAGIIMMFPSLRGGNDNPGQHEGFFGEVDDILSAADFLARQPYVDPARIYLGGHSTGGTLALLVAESTDRFRAVFSFGPADDVSGYEAQYLPFDTSDPREIELRSPGRWLQSVGCPTFVFEGTEQPSNSASLQTMSRSSKNPKLHFLSVRGASHFSILAPTNEQIAAAILHDDGPTTNLTFNESELSQPFAR